MNKWHRIAIEKKYEGCNPKEISEAVNRRFTPETISVYFSKDGYLHADYLLYEAEQNKLREVEGKALFKKNVLKASEALVKVLDRAIERKDDDAIMQAANNILDRAGVVVIRKSEVNQLNDETETITNEQLAEELRKQGLDPATGLRISKAQT